jgi:hypothetical protein
VKVLSEWESFYVIVGSSAGALIGLQFVVITLVAERPALRSAEGGAAFSTPSVVHFAVVLLLSAILSAPWSSVGIVEVVWAFVGLAGMVYTVVVLRRMQVQTIYRPVLEDWLFHVLLPFAAYATLVGSAWLAHTHTHTAFFSVGAATLLLLFVGIHNAWDAATYHVFVQPGQRGGADENIKSSG